MQTPGLTVEPAKLALSPEADVPPVAPATPDQDEDNYDDEGNVARIWELLLELYGDLTEARRHVA